MSIIDGTVDVGHHDAIPIVVFRGLNRANTRQCRLQAVPVRRRFRLNYAERSEGWAGKGCIHLDVRNSEQIESQRTQRGKLWNLQ